MGVGHCRRHSEQDDKSINTDARAEVCSTKRCPKRARTLSRKMLVAPLQKASTADSSNYLLELELKIVEKMHVTKGPEHCPRHVTPCSGSLVTSTDIKIPPPTSSFREKFRVQDAFSSSLQHKSMVHYRSYSQQLTPLSKTHTIPFSRRASAAQVIDHLVRLYCGNHRFIALHWTSQTPCAPQWRARTAPAPLRN